MNIATTLATIRPELNLVENKIKSITESEETMIRQTASHLFEAGGKRIRPVFVLLASKFGDSDRSEVIQVAVALELIHMASLVHDDVIDRASTRRGRSTVNQKWDNGTAMFTGDFIFARSVELLQELGDSRLHQVLAQTIHELCIGEIDQLHDRYRTNQTLTRYFRRIKRKTALLIASSTELGAISAKSDDKQVKHLKNFGYYIGMAYQIIDDILDFTSSKEELGKPAGSDLMNGQLTLPTILAIRQSVIPVSTVENYFTDPSETHDEVMTDTINRIRHSTAIDQSYACSEAYLNKALNELDYLPDISVKHTLKQIAISLGNRKF